MISVNQNFFSFNRTSFQQQLKLTVAYARFSINELQSYILSTTTETDCFDNPPQPTLASVAYTGRYSDLVDKPPRAGSDRDGGDANNAQKVNGYSVTHSYAGGAQQIVVFNGNRLDYINRSDISGNLPQIGGKNFTVTVNGKAKTTNLTVARDAYGRLSGFWKSASLSNYQQFP